MKVYWVCSPLKCFFRVTEEKAEQEVDFRNRNKGAGFFMLEENIPDEDVGRCINDDTPQLAWVQDCSVGMVRKSRNDVQNDDGTCRTCPYFEASEITARKKK